MNSEKEVEYMVFPRLLALSEVLWTNPKLKNWNDFKNRLLNHFYILDLLQINYKKRIPEKL
jgi:hexosaminidase